MDDKLDSNNGNIRPVRTAIIGGTFNALHQGHQEYIKLAFDFADKIYILLTTDDYARNFKSYDIHPFQYRKRRIVQYLNQNSICKGYSIYPMDSERYLISFCLEHNITMAIIIPENYSLFEKINRLRETENKPSILILIKQRTKTTEGFDINSTLIKNLKYDKYMTSTIEYSHDLTHPD